MVENVMPDREVRHDEQKCHHQQQRQAADHRHVEQKFRRDQNQRDLHIADADIRHDFADEHFARAHRRREQIFHRAALAFARDGQRGDHHHRHRQHHAHESGHDVILRDVFGIVMLMHDQVERRGTALQFRQRPGQVAIQNRRRQRIHRGNRVTDRRRIGRVGFEEQIRFFAAQQFARKVHGNFHDELHLGFLASSSWISASFFGSRVMSK
jgi:hypothetical protein